MKKLTMWLGCALTALAIGCGEEGSKAPVATTPDPAKMMPDPAKMPGMKPPATPASNGTSADKPADADKQEGDTEKKEGDTEKKEGDTEKKEGDAGEK